MLPSRCSQAHTCIRDKTCIKVNTLPTLGATSSGAVHVPSSMRSEHTFMTCQVTGVTEPQTPSRARGTIGAPGGSTEAAVVQVRHLRVQHEQRIPRRMPGLHLQAPLTHVLLQAPLLRAAIEKRRRRGPARQAGKAGNHTARRALNLVSSGHSGGRCSSGTPEVAHSAASTSHLPAARAAFSASRLCKDVKGGWKGRTRDLLA